MYADLDSQNVKDLSEARANVQHQLDRVQHMRQNIKDMQQQLDKVSGRNQDTFDTSASTSLPLQWITVLEECVLCSCPSSCTWVSPNLQRLHGLPKARPR